MNWNIWSYYVQSVECLGNHLFLYLSFQCAIMASWKITMFKTYIFKCIVFFMFFPLSSSFLCEVLYIYDISIVGGFKPTHPKNRGRLDPNTSLHQGGCPKVGDWLGAWELSRGGFLSFVLKRFDVEHKHEILIDVDDYWELWLNLTYCMKHDRYRCIVV